MGCQPIINQAVSQSIRLHEFALRYVRIYPVVNSLTELVTLAPSVRNGASRRWLGDNQFACLT